MRHADLDGRPSPDSSSRLALANLGFDLTVVDGEAKLVFAHLQDALAELFTQGQIYGGRDGEK
ncbi:MAG: hypothetical protein ACK4NZ_02060 [Tsuneonella sp.]